MGDSPERYDRMARRCPMLGHRITFSYCRAPGADLPCRKIFDCWWESFDVLAFVGEHYGEAAIARITEPPQEKMLTLLELIERARSGTDS